MNIVKAVDDGLQILIQSADESTRKIIASSVTYMRNLTAVFWISALITANMMCINSAVQSFFYEPDKTSYPPTILRSWFPFENYSNHFWLIYIVQYYIMNVGMLIAFMRSWHAFIVSMMVFVITKLKILNHKLAETENESQLVKCIDEREKLFGTVHELSSLISSSVFLDFLVFSVLLCTLLFQATQVNIQAKCETWISNRLRLQVEDDVVQLAIIFFYILTMTTILWMYYHHANEITFYVSWKFNSEPFSVDSNCRAISWQRQFTCVRGSASRVDSKNSCWFSWNHQSPSKFKLESSTWSWTRSLPSWERLTAILLCWQTSPHDRKFHGLCHWFNDLEIWNLCRRC